MNYTVPDFRPIAIVSDGSFAAQDSIFFTKSTSESSLVLHTFKGDIYGKIISTHRTAKVTKIEIEDWQSNKYLSDIELSTYACTTFADVPTRKYVYLMQKHYYDKILKRVQVPKYEPLTAEKRAELKSNVNVTNTYLHIQNASYSMIKMALKEMFDKELLDISIDCDMLFVQGAPINIELFIRALSSNDSIRADGSDVIKEIETEM